MKENAKIITIGFGAVLVGFLVGYLVFNSSKETTNNPIAIQAEIPDHGDEQIWTCSMHPQIRQNEMGECPICGMDLIPLIANSSNDPLVLEMTADAVKLASIQTTVVGQTSMQASSSIRLSGKVQADERRASSQVAHVPGRIEKLYVSFTGESVTAGQRIADLYSPSLVSAQQELIEALKLREVNSDLLVAARNKLRYWKIPDTTIAQIEKEGKIQEIFPLYAGASGVVVNRKVSVGDYVQQGEPLFELMNLGRVWVLFDAYEEDLSKLKIGDRIEFTTPSIPNRTFKTKVTFIDPVINSTTRVASIRTEISNSGGLLKPEMLVYGLIYNKIAGGSTLVIPKSAVLWTGDRSVAYIKVPESSLPSFQFREIELGDRMGEDYQVLSGIEHGEEVVTYGSFSIDAAAQLNNQASMMNRNVQIKGQVIDDDLPDYSESTPELFKKQLAHLSDAYLKLKDDLVATDADAAVKSAKEMLASLDVIDIALLDNEPYLFWMDQLAGLALHGEKIAAAIDVEEQRKQFDFLSQVLIKSIKVFGIKGQTLYVQHCPMAIGDDGADWLSSDAEVMNPYFGDKMLKCGFVKDTIDVNFRNAEMRVPPKTSPSTHNH